MSGENRGDDEDPALIGKAYGNHESLLHMGHPILCHGLKERRDAHYDCKLSLKVATEPRYKNGPMSKSNPGIIPSTIPIIMSSS